jgi:hypothetical protein
MPVMPASLVSRAAILPSGGGGEAMVGVVLSALALNFVWIGLGKITQ